jgi:hypothetical protein
MTEDRDAECWVSRDTCDSRADGADEEADDDVDRQADEE